MTTTPPVPPDDRISAYLDDELRPDERRTVEGHLAFSPEWRAVLGDVAWARNTLRALPQREAPAGFWDHVLGHDELAQARSRRRARIPRAALWASVALAGAAVAAAVFSVPSSHEVTPQVPHLTDSHAVRQSVSDDPVGQLATLSLVAPFRK